MAFSDASRSGSPQTLRPGWFTLEPPRSMRPAGFDRDVELRVALPLSYHESDRVFPTMWITDTDLETALDAVGQREIILVGVGSPRTGPGYDHRRVWDFYPEQDILPLSPFRDFVLAHLPSDLPRHPGGGARRFLDFLVDEARPALASHYRTDPDDHALAGHSGAGWFVMYALFSRPGSFAKYVAGAPSLYFSRDLIWQLEERYAAGNDDLDVTLFLGVGDAEMTAPEAAFGCFSSMAKMAEILTCRRYPSLQLTVKVFPGETHASARPFVLSNAVRSLWGG